MRRAVAWAAAVVLAGTSAIAAAAFNPGGRIPFLRNRNTLSSHLSAHILIGEPVATSPGYALGACRLDAHAGLTCGAGDGAARVIAKTISPSRRLALAWRSPSGPPTEEPDADDLELLLIRLSDGAVLSQQKGAYWDTGESHANREYEKAAWSPDSRLMVETYDTRFSTDGLTVTAIGADDTASAPLDLLKVMEPAARAQLKRAIKDDEGYVFSIYRIAIDNRGTIRAVVQMWVPKDGPFAAFDVTATVTRKGDALDARVTSVQRSREKL